jgi:hypothetical protein
MLRATIELIPLGDENEKRVIYEVDIENVSDGLVEADYDYTIRSPGELPRFGSLTGFKRSEGALALLRRVLEGVA